MGPIRRKAPFRIGIDLIARGASPSAGAPATGSRGPGDVSLPTFAILLFAYVLSQFYRAFLAVIAADLGRDLGAGPADLGAMSAAWLWTFALAQIPLGYALDRFGARLTLGTVLFAAAVGAAALALARTSGSAIVAMGLIGLGCAPILMAGYVILARTFPARDFALMSSLLLGFGCLGDPLSSTPLVAAVAAWGWRGAVWVSAGVTAACAAAVLVVLPDPPRPPIPAGGGSFVRGLLDTIKLRDLWPLLPITFVSYAVVIAVRSLWITAYLASVHGFDLAAQSRAALAMGLAIAAGAALYGPLERALGRPKLIVTAGVSVTAGAFLLLAAFGADSAALASMLLVLIGLAGVTYAILMAHARAFFPVHLLGRGVTFMNLLFIGGGGFLQSVSGRYVQAAHAANVSPGLIYGRMFAAFGALLLAAVAIYAASREAPSVTRPVPEP